MNRRVMQVLITTSILLFSSLAGCLDSEEDSDSEYTVIASTYHVGQIASAIGGSQVNVQILSPSNVPVHDFEPSANDILTLAKADLFLYHGLGLEPWVDATLSAMGDDEPRNMYTHAMPDGQQAFDYESLLLMDLCEHLSEGPYEASALVDEEEHAEDVELHAEHVAHTLTLPEEEHDDDDHDDHSDEHAEDGDDHGDEHADHDDHGDDHGDHGDEDGHEGHGHGEPMETITSPTDCPADSVVYIFELGEGEHVLEFGSEEDVHEFNMVVLKMGGGHAHHDHGDDDHDDHAEDGDDHGDDDHDDHAEDGDDHGDHDDNEDMTPEHALEMFDTNNDSAVSWDEFWASWEEDHNHDDDQGEMVCYDMSTHSVNTSYDTQAECEAAGLMWTAATGGNHDDHDAFEEAAEEYMMSKMMDAFNASDADNDTLLQLSELSTFIASMDTIEDEMESASVEIMMIAFDDDNDGQLSMSEFMHMMESMEDEDHDEDHDGEDHATVNETEMMEMMFTMLDMDNNSFLDASELAMFTDMDEHEEEGMGYATLHIEEEGEYGFALPTSIKFHILKGEGGHDDHDDHDDHAGEDGHDDHAGEDDHDDHSDEEGDDHSDHADEEIAFDPHSWLDPLAFKAQVNRVLDEMKIAFPDLADSFQSNADAYMASLDALHLKYEDTFGPNGTCEKDTVVSNHNAYSYMSQRYGMEFITVHGLDPEGEPSAADILDVVEQITEDGITVFYVEEFTDLSAVSSIVEQTKTTDMPNGVEIQILYTMELQPKDSSDDYLSLMEKNLEALKSGLSC